MGIALQELFPTNLTIIIFVLYMLLFIGQGIFITASQEVNSSYKYNTVTVVLLTEVLKFFVSIVLYCNQKSLITLFKDIWKDVNVMLLYFVPALLYCLYNNLAFINLSVFDPTTYYLLLQLRVVVTGILFQIIFKKHLTRRQWLSLLLLTFGCMLKQLNLTLNIVNNDVNSTKATIVESSPLAYLNYSSSSAIKVKSTHEIVFGLNGLLIIVQTILSCLAGVYNEYLLKNNGANVNIFVQNVYMYIDSIICNIFVLLLRNELFDAFTWTNLNMIFRFKVVIIIINNAAIGIVTSFFLKHMNSILKTFASALELVFTAILCYVLFGIPIYLNTALAIIVVSFAIYLYSQSPVVNTSVKRIHLYNNDLPTRHDGDKQKLLNPKCNKSTKIDIV